MMRFKHLLLLPISLICVSGTISFESSNEVKTEQSSNSYTPRDYSSYTKETLNPDVSNFKVLTKAGSPEYTVDTEKQTFTTQGNWFSSFVGDTTLDTDVDYFTLKAHVETGEESIGPLSDAGLGFAYYFGNENVTTMYVNWADYVANEKSIGGLHFCGTVGGTDIGCQCETYATALLPSGKFYAAGDKSTSNPFVDYWADDPGKFLKGEDRNTATHYDVTNNGYVFLDKGFDITLHFEKATYEERDCALVQIQIDAFNKDGTTPMRFFSPQIAIDAYTQPLGTDSPFKGVAPTIGFYNYNTGKVVYSNIEFTKYTKPSTKGSTFSNVGMQFDEFDIDNDKKTMSIKCDSQEKFSSAFAIADSIDFSLDSKEFSCDVSGTTGVISDAQIGFVYYYNETNYILAYFKWNERVETIAEVDFRFCVDGSFVDKCQNLRYPWDAGFSNHHTFTTYYSDNDAFITDTRVPVVADGNFNKMRSESAITISSGFNMGIIKSRKNYMYEENKTRLIDGIQLRVTAKGTDGKTHSWYTPTCFVDAFTCPFGSAESAFVNEIPSIGVYTFNTGTVNFKNFKYGEMVVYPKDPSKYEFGDSTIGNWTVTGSNKGENWSISEENKSISGLYEDLVKSTHKNEVTALTSNTLSNLFIGAKLQIQNVYDTEGYISIIPYYLDKNNYLSVSFFYNLNGVYLGVSGKKDGNFIFGQEYAFTKTLDITKLDSLYVEAEINSNTVNVYIEGLPHSVISLDLSKYGLSSRTLNDTDSKVGFGIYNVDGSFTDYVTNGTSRIKPVTPTEEDIPTIVENGSRNQVGYVGHTVTIPSYHALNFVGEIIDASVSVTDSSGKTIEVTNNSFVPTEKGDLTVTVNATDEWGRFAETLTYSINISEYVPTYNSFLKEPLWQTTFVFCFFGALIGLIGVCAVLLIRKNKIEAKKAAILNQKNQSKDVEEADDE